MISIKLGENEYSFDSNSLLTYVEFLERDEIAKEKQNIEDGLNKLELLLIYTCYLVDKVFPNVDDNNIYDDESYPVDVSIINCILFKLASIDPTYEDRIKWLSEAVKIIYDIFISFIETEDKEELIKTSFTIADNIIYDMVLKTINMKYQQWDYLAIYDKAMITKRFENYMNSYMNTIDSLYGNEDNEDDDEVMNDISELDKYM